MPRVSIVIPVWNNIALTRDCLASVFRHTPQDLYEVVVVDNGSTDGVTDYLRALDAEGRIRAIFNADNRGFAKASNQGAQAALGEYILFLNNDTLALPGWLPNLVQGFEAVPSTGIAGAKLLYADDSIQHAGVAWTTGRQVMHIYRQLHRSHPAVNKSRAFQAVTGACLLMPRDLFISQGGFDEGYVNGIEDVDLCMRIRAQGLAVRYVPEAELYHLESMTPGRHKHEKHNSQRFFRRWLESIYPDELSFYAADGLEMMTDQRFVSRGLVFRDRNPNPALSKARALQAQGDAEAAILAFRQAMHFNPFDVRNLTTAKELAACLSSLGRYEEAAPLLGLLEEINQQAVIVA
jgi:GT2 family glycosyltransferase